MVIIFSLQQKPSDSGIGATDSDEKSVLAAMELSLGESSPELPQRHRGTVCQIASLQLNELKRDLNKNIIFFT